MDGIKFKKGFFKNNYIYILWTAFYFFLTWYMLGMNEITFLFTALIYSITLSLALTDTAEKFLRFLENIRILETKKEKEYLIPIFDEVYEKALSYTGRLPDIAICVIDAMYVNAFALGKRTVAVTTGAVNSLSEDELKGFIAHEIGHVVHGHTIAKLFSTIGNGIFMIPIIISKAVINAIELLHSKLNKRGGIVELIIFLIKTIFFAVVFVFVSMGELILSLNSRSNEYQADEFANSIGYGTNLVEALYLLQGMLISDKMDLYEKLTRSHPNIARRIGKLETMIDEPTLPEISGKKKSKFKREKITNVQVKKLKRTERLENMAENETEDLEDVDVTIDNLIDLKVDIEDTQMYVRRLMNKCDEIQKKCDTLLSDNDDEE